MPHIYQPDFTRHNGEPCTIVPYGDTTHCIVDVVNVSKLQSAHMGNYFEDLTIESVDCGHWIMLEKPTEMWQKLRAWIERKPRHAKM